MVDVQKLREERAADVRRREQERRIRVGLDKPPEQERSSGGSSGTLKYEVRDQTGKLIARSTSEEAAQDFIRQETLREKRAAVQRVAPRGPTREAAARLDEGRQYTVQEAPLRAGSRESIEQSTRTGILRSTEKRRDGSGGEQVLRTIDNTRPQTVSRTERLLLERPDTEISTRKPVIRTRPIPQQLRTVQGRRNLMLAGVIGVGNFISQPAPEYVKNPRTGQPERLTSGVIATPITTGSIGAVSEGSIFLRGLISTNYASRKTARSINALQQGPLASEETRMITSSPQFRDVLQAGRARERSNTNYFRQLSIDWFPALQYPLGDPGAFSAGTTQKAREMGIPEERIPSIVSAAEGRRTTSIIGGTASQVVSGIGGELTGRFLIAGAGKVIPNMLKGSELPKKLAFQQAARSGVAGIVEGSAQESGRQVAMDERTSVGRIAGYGGVGSITAAAFGYGLGRTINRRSLNLLVQGAGNVLDVTEFPSDVAASALTRTGRVPVLTISEIPTSPFVTVQTVTSTESSGRGGGMTSPRRGGVQEAPGSARARSFLQTVLSPVTPAQTSSSALSDTNVLSLVSSQESTAAEVPDFSKTSLFVPSTSTSTSTTSTNTNTATNLFTDTFTNTNTATTVSVPSMSVVPKWATLPPVLPPLFGGGGSGGGVAVRKRPRFVNELAASIALLGKLTSPRAQYVRPSTGTNSRKRKDSTKKRQKKRKGKKKQRIADTPNVSLRPASSSSARKVLRGLFR